MCNNTLVRTCNIIDNDRVNSEFPHCNDVNLKAIKSHFKGSYNKRNLTQIFKRQILLYPWADFI